MRPRNLIYYEVKVKYHPGPVNLFVVEPSAGPVRAIRLDHQTWSFDPTTVQARLMDDFDQGENQILRVDRTRAEEIALLLEAVLPDETQLRHLMQDGADKTTS